MTALGSHLAVASLAAVATVHGVTPARCGWRCPCGLAFLRFGHAMTHAWRIHSVG